MLGPAGTQVGPFESQVGGVNRVDSCVLYHSQALSTITFILRTLTVTWRVDCVCDSHARLPVALIHSPPRVCCVPSLGRRVCQAQVKWGDDHVAHEAEINDIGDDIHPHDPVASIAESIIPQCSWQIKMGFNYTSQVHPPKPSPVFLASLYAYASASHAHFRWSCATLGSPVPRFDSGDRGGKSP